MKITDNLEGDEDIFIGLGLTFIIILGFMIGYLL